jgi:hypothetical protein
VHRSYVNTTSSPENLWILVSMECPGTNLLQQLRTTVQWLFLSVHISLSRIKQFYSPKTMVYRGTTAQQSWAHMTSISLSLLTLFLIQLCLCPHGAAAVITTEESTEQSCPTVDPVFVCSLHFQLLFFFGSTGDWTQGLTLELCPWLFCFILFLWYWGLNSGSGTC